MRKSWGSWKILCAPPSVTVPRIGHNKLVNSTSYSYTQHPRKSRHSKRWFSCAVKLYFWKSATKITKRRKNISQSTYLKILHKLSKNLHRQTTVQPIFWNSMKIKAFFHVLNRLILFFFSFDFENDFSFLFSGAFRIQYSKSVDWVAPRSYG